MAGTKQGTRISQFSMGALDFERYHLILTVIDELAIAFESGKYKYAGEYLAALSAFYRYMRGLLLKSKQKEFDKKFKDFKKIIRTNKMTIEQADSLTKLHTDIYTMRQTVGLGISTRSKPPQGVFNDMVPEV